MTTTETMSHRRFATNRITDMYQKLEQSKPLAVRLARDSTAGPTLYSDDPRSTWGFNPFVSPQKPTGKKLCFGSFFSQVVTYIIEHKGLDALTRINIEPEPVGYKTYWYKKTRASPHWTSTSEDSDLLTRCIIYRLLAPQVEQVAIAPAATEKVEPALSAEATDYLEPVTFGWTRRGFRARAAARQFSENVYGDH
jgi:hypothetical protein